ncbi:MAG: hypothetical protein IPM08_00440 [Actinomycetales bacterium]|nr:hypothetical protein [Actinomycetales bacterium]
MTSRAHWVVLSHACAAVGMSLPWPVLLVTVEATTDSATLLGVAAAARLLPYVALSWLSGRLADRRERARIVRLSLWARLLLLLGCAIALDAGHVALAGGCATGAVVAAPAYPALAAGMPRLAGAQVDRATRLLVTVEVSSFVVGPALGGLAVGHGSTGRSSWLARCSWLWPLGCSGELRCPRQMPHQTPRGRATPSPTSAWWRYCRARREPRQALAVVVALNAVLAAVGLMLLDLALRVWGSGAQGFGHAMAALGAGRSLRRSWPGGQTVGDCVRSSSPSGVMVAIVAVLPGERGLGDFRYAGHAHAVLAPGGSRSRRPGGTCYDGHAERCARCRSSERPGLTTPP